MTEVAKKKWRVRSHTKNENHVVLKEHKNDRVAPGLWAGFNTRGVREEGVYGFFSDLFHLKFKIESIQNLKVKHVCAVQQYWEVQGLSRDLITQRMTVVFMFCTWIGKKELEIAAKLLRQQEKEAEEEVLRG
jgi:hypothetical protein